MRSKLDIVLLLFQKSLYRTWQPQTAIYHFAVPTYNHEYQSAGNSRRKFDTSFDRHSACNRLSKVHGTPGGDEGPHLRYACLLSGLSSVLLNLANDCDRFLSQR